jgi:serine/threonine-protein kinase
VSFRVLGPWDVPTSRAPRSTGISGLNEAMALLGPTLLVAGVLLALRNLRLGRGDRRGAFRLAAALFVCRFLYWVFGAGHELSREQDLFDYGVARSLFFAGYAWLMYVALEPYVRRRWPATLISWSRLLSGRILDPLVGRDVLVGALLGIASFLFSVVAFVGTAALGRPPSRLMEIDLDHLLGLRHFLARLFLAPSNAVLMSFFVLLALLVLRLLLRRPALATLASILLWTFMMAATWGGTPAAVLAAAGMMTLLVITVVRLGLLALIVATFLGTLEAPVSPHFSAWYALPGIYAWILLVGLTGFACYAALGRRGLLKEWLEE